MYIKTEVIKCRPSGSILWSMFTCLDSLSSQRETTGKCLHFFRGFTNQVQGTKPFFVVPYCDLQGLMASLNAALSTRKMVLTLGSGVLC